MQQIKQRHSRWRSRGGDGFVDINITPFVDVVLVLLIIFMVSAPILLGGVDVSLPSGDSKPIEQEASPITVTISENSDVYVGDKLCKINKIVNYLEQITDSNYSSKILIKGDRAVNYGKIMEVIKTINHGGFTKVVLVTEINQDS